ARRGPAAHARRAVAAGSRGFTLVEVLIALIVFAIGALRVGAVVPLGINGIQAAALQTRASELAAQRAEQLLDTPYDDADLLSGTHQDPANPYERTYYVDLVVYDDQPAAHCKRVTISLHLH